MPNPSQPDLLASSLDSFSPIAGDGPRLWVRRLVIWHSPDEPPVRDIQLRTGLNIVWSPDSGAEGEPMGHGGGKTSFCRLIRYCLGENSFGTEGQRQRIATALPDAHVGAEVILDGQEWSVLRPIGAGHSNAPHCAVKGSSLDHLIGLLREGNLPNPTMNPLRTAIAEALMPTAAPQMPGGSSLAEGWEVALAWLTRDQECRLVDILDWRASESQSASPARHMSKPDRLRAVRLLLKALQQDEIDASRRAQEHKQKADEANKRKQRVEQVREDIARNLGEIFGYGDDGAAAPDLWAGKARAVESAEKLRADPLVDQKLQDARALMQERESAFRALDKRLIEIDAILPQIDDTLRVLSGAEPKALLKYQDAANPLCPTCGTPVTPASQILIDQQKAAWAKIIEERGTKQKEKSDLISEQGVVKGNAALARQQLDQAKSSFVTLEKTTQERSDALASATGYVTLTSHYPSYLIEIARHDAEAKRHLEGQDQEQRKANEARRAAQGIVNRLSELFDLTIRYLVPEGATGAVLLNESGIDPVIKLHGDLTTAAIESLKVVAFDLAALMLTMEGKTELPGLWLHDSPREADLGLAIYHRLFEFALWLERRNETPQFQYIVTTTTAPPRVLCAEPWLVLELRSAPTPSRLFQRDL